MAWCRTLAALLALAFTWGPSVAFAQPMTPTPTQRAYNDRGVQHMFDGEFDQAAANFKSSLSLGESNIAWLNYGRALFKMQRCHEALDAFDKVPVAPSVDAPSPREIATVLDRFAAEWSASCTGRLTLECPDHTTMVRLDDSEAFECHPDPIPVTPGLHTVSIVDWDESFEVAVAAEPAMLSLQRSLAPPTDSDGSPGETIELREESDVRYAASNPRRLIGLSAAAVGVAALGTSLALEAAWVAPAFDNYRAAETPETWQATRDIARNRQRANRVLLFSGLGVTAIGATLFLLPTRDDKSVAVTLGLSGPTAVSAKVTW